jgi:hypothetical protein
MRATAPNARVYAVFISMMEANGIEARLAPADLEFEGPSPFPVIWYRPRRGRLARAGQRLAGVIGAVLAYWVEAAVIEQYGRYLPPWDDCTL